MNRKIFYGVVWSCLLAIASLAEGAKFSEGPIEQNARVIVVREPAATHAFLPVNEKIPPMIERGILALTGKTNSIAAWLSLVSTNDVIGIKVFSSPGSQSGTRPAVVAALVKSMIAAGISPERIIIWDRQLVHLRLAGFFELVDAFKVRVQSAAEAGFDPKVSYENAVLGEPVWGDLEFGQKGDSIGRRSYVSKLVTKEITKIINVSPMLNHHFAGVTGNLYSLAMGSVDNAMRFEHSAQRLAVAVPEIYGLPELFDRVVLNITDALLCQYEGEQRSLLHYSVPLNELRFSRDGVALDVLSLLEIGRQRRNAKMNSRKPNLELYQNGSILELGVSEEKRIRLEVVTVGSTNAAQTIQP